MTERAPDPRPRGASRAPVAWAVAAAVAALLLLAATGVVPNPLARTERSEGTRRESEEGLAGLRSGKSALASARVGADATAEAGALPALRGRIISGPDGKPVAGAVIEVRAFHADGVLMIPILDVDEMTRRTAVADAQGLFAIPALPAGRLAYLVRDARGQGLATGVFQHSLKGRLDMGDLVLSGAGSIGGRVAWADGSPVARARVSVHVPHDPERDPNGDITFDSEAVDWTVGWAVTAADGSWNVGGVPAGNTSVRVRAESGEAGFLSPVRVIADRTRGDVNVELARGRDISGKVVTSDGARAAGAVVLVAERRDDDGSVDQWLRTVPCDAEGRFQIRGAPLRDQYLTGLDPGLRVAGRARVSSDAATVEIRLSPPAVLVGRVQHAGSREPVTAFRLWAIPAPESDEEPPERVVFDHKEWPEMTREYLVALQVLKSGHAPWTPLPFDSPDGTFRLAGLGGGTTRVRIDAPGRCAEERTVVLPHGGEVDLGVIELREGYEITGTVTDVAGLPAADESVMAEPDSEGEAGAWHARTDDGGRFTLVDVPPGRYALSASSGVVQVEVDVGPGGVADVALVDRSDTSIEVRVFDAGGRPASGVEVVATDGGGTESEWTGRDGRAAFDEVGAGRWAVAWASSRLRQAPKRGEEIAHVLAGPASATVEVKEGAVARVVLRLPPLATISGRVRDGTGARAMGSVILSGRGEMREVSADATGAFALRYVEDGSYRLFLIDSDEAVSVNVVSAKDQEIDVRAPEQRKEPASAGAVDDEK